MDTNVPPHKESNPIGPLIGSIVIIIILTLGGLYFWADHLRRDAKVRSELERVRKEFATASSTDDLPSIEADLKKVIPH